ncbi:MAG: NAD(P)/FAD-dependent oxidoreductase, partial [Planctomycetota bacterium]
MGESAREREVLPVDILFVGAGPANLAAAFHLASSLKKQGKELEIAIIEKSMSIGAHILSGAILDPRALEELIPDWQGAGCPVESPVTGEAVYLLSQARAWRIPFVPPFLNNHGLFVVTLSDVVAWLKEKVEELGVMVFEGFPGHELLWEGNRVTGVRTIDKGLNKDGSPGPNFEPGADLQARCVILGEGPRGSLTKSLTEKLGLQGANPQTYGTGCKEVWQLPEGRFPAGRVVHSAGWPLSGDQYGGSWI